MESLKNFSCGLCAVGFDTHAELKRHKQQAEHVSFHDTYLFEHLSVGKANQAPSLWCAFW